MPVKMLGFIVVLLVCSFTKVLVNLTRFTQKKNQYTIFQSLPEEMQELIDTLHRTCVGETGVSEGNYDYCLIYTIC